PGDPVSSSRANWMARTSRAMTDESSGLLLRPEPLRGREPARRELAGAGAFADPVAPLGPLAGAAGGVDPGRPLLGAKHQGVAQAALAVALQLDALAARHLGQLVQAEDQDLAV